MRNSPKDPSMMSEPT